MGNRTLRTYEVLNCLTGSSLIGFFIFVFGLLLSGAAAGADAIWLQGAYFDNLNKANIKEGVLFLGKPERELTPEERAAWKSQNIPFKYADVELGVEGAKATMGIGVVTGPEIPLLPRIGLSYAHFRTQNLAGVEAVMSAGAPAEPGIPIPVGISFKVGYYVGLGGTPNRFMAGLGLGL